MAAAERFEFLAVELPADGDLHLVLAECQPAATNPWGVPAGPTSGRLRAFLAGR
jgi:hypothetical protein